MDTIAEKLTPVILKENLKLNFISKSYKKTHLFNRKI